MINVIEIDYIQITHIFSYSFDFVVHKWIVTEISCHTHQSMSFLHGLHDCFIHGILYLHFFMSSMVIYNPEMEHQIWASLVWFFVIENLFDTRFMDICEKTSQYETKCFKQQWICVKLRWSNCMVQLKVWT